jgi:hypothetical protein
MICRLFYILAQVFECLLSFETVLWYYLCCKYRFWNRMQNVLIRPFVPVRYM